MDLYRIDFPEEFEMIGGEEFFFSGGITVIEWAEKIKDLLPPSAVRICIGLNGTARTIEIKGLAL